MATMIVYPPTGGTRSAFDPTQRDGLQRSIPLAGIGERWADRRLDEGEAGPDADARQALAEEVVAIPA